MEGWIGLVGALAGVLVGAVAEAFRNRVAFRRDKGWTLLEQRRGRI
jgi:hypothetical protein